MNSDYFYKQVSRKIDKINFILEIAYQGNVGLHEMMQFFQVATDEEKAEFETFMELGNLSGAWELVQRVTNTRLIGL